MSIPKSENYALLFVALLDYFGRDDLNLAGGKAANLGELSRAGLTVPPGFVITTAAYDHLLKKDDAQSQLDQLFSSCDFDNPASVAATSQKIGNLFQNTSIPEQLKREILEAYHALGESAVAVRSSATAEDLPGAAFAGQQETFLNVVGREKLIEAVRACWASLWSERAILYRRRQGIDQATVRLAVVVQKMISADAAGVMFTANPVSGQRDELSIDANPGLGEAVVGGLVTPDHFVVNKRKRHITKKQVGKRELIIRSKMGGGTEQIHSTAEISGIPFLPDAAVLKISQIGINIERHYGAPQDIEWAWVQDHSRAGKFYILQSRPMTALPDQIKVSGPMRMVLPMLAEMWPSRPYPLDMTTFTGAIERAIGNLLVVMIGKSAPNPDEAFVEEDGVVVEFKPPQVHPSPSMFFTPWSTMWKTRKYDPSRWEEDLLLADYLAKVNSLEKRDPRSQTWNQNIETLEEALKLLPQLMKLRERYLPKTFLGLGGLWILLSLARRGSQMGTLLSGVRTKTTETNEALEALAQQIRAEKSLQDLFLHGDVQALMFHLESSEQGQDFLKQFEEFLSQYGHREISLTISEPAWKDAPERVLSILKVLAGTEVSKPESYDAWQRAREEALNHSMLETFIFRKLFVKCLTNARSLFQIREDTHFYATMVQPGIRRIALEMGSRLVDVDALDNAEDVFHLELDELRVFGEEWPPSRQTVEQIRTLVARRKAKRDSLANKPMIDPRFLAAEPRIGEGILLSGTSGSPGIARGPVKIVHDALEFENLRPGDVLVAPVTNPAWTPLFQRAAAVVVDTGGSASHAAIVAREYGIPAVMGTMNGTKELVDGQWIEVDGSRGLVLKTEAKE